MSCMLQNYSISEKKACMQYCAQPHIASMVSTFAFRARAATAFWYRRRQLKFANHLYCRYYMYMGDRSISLWQGLNRLKVEKGPSG